MALGAALMQFGAGMRQRRDANQAREDRMREMEEERMWREQERQDRMNRWMVEDKRAAFQEARQLRDDLGPGVQMNLPPERRAQLSEAGLGFDETTLPSKQIGPSISSGGFQTTDSPARNQFYIPANALERRQEQQVSQAAGERADLMERQRRQDERQRVLDERNYAQEERAFNTPSPAQIALADRAHAQALARIKAQMDNQRSYIDPVMAQEWEILKATEPNELADPSERIQWMQQVKDFQDRLTMGKQRPVDGGGGQVQLGGQPPPTANPRQVENEPSRLSRWLSMIYPQDQSYEPWAGRGIEGPIEQVPGRRLRVR